MIVIRFSFLYFKTRGCDWTNTFLLLSHKTLYFWESFERFIWKWGTLEGSHVVILSVIYFLMLVSWFQLVEGFLYMEQDHVTLFNKFWDMNRNSKEDKYLRNYLFERKSDKVINNFSEIVLFLLDYYFIMFINLYVI